MSKPIWELLDLSRADRCVFDAGLPSRASARRLRVTLHGNSLESRPNPLPGGTISGLALSTCPAERIRSMLLCPEVLGSSSAVGVARQSQRTLWSRAAQCWRWASTRGEAKEMKQVVLQRSSRSGLRCCCCLQVVPRPWVCNLIPD